MTYKKNSVKKAISVRLTDSLRERIDKKANDENRSRNNLIEYALKFYLKVTGKE
jgi:predicted transcriptional regulator